MKKVRVEEGSWVEIVNSSQERLLGKLKKYDETLPFNEDNLCFYHEGEKTPIMLEQIVQRYPKVVLAKKIQKINPSKRENENESE